MSLCYRYVLRKMGSGHEIFLLDDEEHPDWVDCRDAVEKRRDEIRVQNRCYHCQGPIAAIGHRRLNGANHPDWGARLFHKRCFASILREFKKQEVWVMPSPSCTPPKSYSRADGLCSSRAPCSATT